MVELAEITSPVAPDMFLSTYWTRRAVYLHDQERRFDRYFGWDALNALLNSGELVYPRTAVGREDRTVEVGQFTTGSEQRVVDPAAVMRLFREGASFSIRGVDGFWPPLRAITAGLYDALFESVHTNVYCSPEHSQGFSCHYDLHEVFVLQIEGTKRWKVFEPTKDFPVEPWRPEDVPGESVAPYLDCTLGKGDVLYVPRGHWHYAVAEDGPSLHVTAGVKCRNADTWLEWLGRELHTSAIWRENVPIMGRSSADGSFPLAADFAQWLERVREVLLDKLREPDLSERFAADLFTQTSPVLPVRMPEDGGSPLPVEQRRFQRPPGQRHLVSSVRGNGVLLKVAGTEMELEGVDPRLLARILAAPAVTLRDLHEWAPEMTEPDRAELLESLAQAGLLIAAPHAP